MVLDFAKEAIDNTGTHSINFDELRAGKANIKVFGMGGCGSIGRVGVLGGHWSDFGG